MSETRETFSGLADWEIVVWYGLTMLSVAVFALGVAQLVRKYRHGRGAATQPRLKGIAQALLLVATHRSIRRRDLVSGLGHALVFYGFLTLFLGTVILALQDDVARPLLGFDFWYGDFYLGYSLVLDLFGLGLTVGLAVMAVRRIRLRHGRLDYRRPDRAENRSRYVIGDWIFLVSLLLLALTGFLLESVRIA